MRAACRVLLGLWLSLYALDGISQPRTDATHALPPSSRPTRKSDDFSVTATALPVSTAPRQPAAAPFSGYAARPQKEIKSIWDRWLASLLIAAIGSGAGAFGGAWVVFWLQGRKEERQRRENEIRELRRVQFAVADRVMVLDSLWNQWLAPAQAHERHWAALQPPLGFTTPTAISLERVGFLLEVDPNLLGKLNRDEQMFQGLLATVTLYSKWREDASRRLEERTERDARNAFSREEIETHAGPRLHFQLKGIAESLYKTFPDLRRELIARFDELAHHLRVGYDAKTSFRIGPDPSEKKA